MPKDSAALAADALLAEAETRVRDEACVIDLDAVAHRRERLAACAEATRPVVIYRFVFPEGALVAALGRAAELRDARAQLELVVGLTGGGLVRSHGGLVARIPRIFAPRFESLARPLIQAYLVSLNLGEPG